MARFSVIVISSMRPSRRRSSGTKPIPRAIASGRGGERAGLAVDLEHAAVEPVRAEERPQELGALGPDQPGNAEDLARVEIEAHILEDAALGQVARAQPDFAGAARTAASGASAASDSRASFSPTMRCTTRGRSMSATALSATTLPSRMIVTVSQTAKISSSTWLM